MFLGAFELHLQFVVLNLTSFVCTHVVYTGLVRFILHLPYIICAVYKVILQIVVSNVDMMHHFYLVESVVYTCDH